MAVVLELERAAVAKYLDPQRISSAEQWRQDWIVNAEEGTDVEDVLKPAYWAHCSQQFSPFDHIEVRAETGEWLLWLVVLATERSSAHVHLLQRFDLPGAGEVKLVAAEHDVRFKGPQNKWTVVRTHDGAVVSKGHLTELIAKEWLNQHEQTIHRT